MKHFAYNLLSFIGQHWPLKRGTGWLVERPARLLHKWPEKKRFSFRDGRIFEGNLNDPLYRSLFLYRRYEPDVTKALRCLIQPGDLVFDVGANIGVLTALMASLVGRRGSVFSFEPVPNLFQKLKTTIRLNHIDDIVIPSDLVISDKCDQCVTIYVPNNHSHACSSLRIDDISSATLHTCKSARLDCINTIPRVPDLVKIDVEGAELAVLKGATSWCDSSSPPIFVLEVNRQTAHRFEYEPEDLVEWLAQRKYQTFYWSTCKSIMKHSVGQMFPEDGSLYAIPNWAIDDTSKPRNLVVGSL